MIGSSIFSLQSCGALKQPVLSYVVIHRCVQVPRDFNFWAAGNCNGDSMCRDDFFSDPVAVGYYKDHVKTILNRVNTFNQRLYR